MTVLQAQNKERRETNTNHPTSTFQLFGVQRRGGYYMVPLLHPSFNFRWLSFLWEHFAAMPNTDARRPEVLVFRGSIPN